MRNDCARAGTASTDANQPPPKKKRRREWVSKPTPPTPPPTEWHECRGPRRSSTTTAVICRKCKQPCKYLSDGRVRTCDDCRRTRTCVLCKHPKKGTEMTNVGMCTTCYFETEPQGMWELSSFVIPEPQPPEVETQGRLAACV